MKLKRIPELDILRSLSALWVIGVHFWLLHLLPLALGFETYEQYVQKVGEGLSLQRLLPLELATPNAIFFNAVSLLLVLGYQGVHLFFFLSGFGLTLSRLRKSEESWFNFIGRRFLRLYPTYWILLLVVIAVAVIRVGLFPMPWLLRGIILLDRGIPFAWFMFPLLQFYLLFPWLFRYLVRSSLVQFLTVTFSFKVLYAVLAIAVNFWLFGQIVDHPSYSSYLALSRVFEFCLGMAAAKLYLSHPVLLRRWLKSRLVLAGAVGLEVLGTLLSLEAKALWLPIFGYRVPLGITVSDAFTGVGLAIIGFHLAHVIGRVPFLSKGLVALSHLSYELYLTQFVGLSILARVLRQYVFELSPDLALLLLLPLFGLVVGVDLLAAIALHRVTKLILARLQPWVPTAQ